MATRPYPSLLLPLAVCALQATTACDDGPSKPPQTPATAEPESRFSAQGLQIEEMAGGKILWTGHARTADGDLDGAQVQDLVLRRHPQSPDERPFTIRAPTGHLRFDAGKAEFQDVRIGSDDPAGGELHAPSAAYDQKKNTIVAKGPLRLNAPGLQAEAQGAVVDLTGQSISLDGPVQGRFDPGAAP